MLWIVLLVGVNLFNCAECADSVIFQCNRTTQLCQNSGVCDGRSKLCVCRGDYGGVSCNTNIRGYAEDTTGQKCSKQCKNGGRCVYDKQFQQRPDICLCPPDYTGSSCEQSRVRLVCNGTAMQVFFTPVQPYWGMAYVGASADLQSCHLQGGFTATTYSQTFTLDSSCDANIEKNPQTGDVTHSRQLHIQFNTEFIGTADIVYDVTCTHTARVTARTEQEPSQSQGHTASSSGLILADQTTAAPSARQLSRDVITNQDTYISVVTLRQPGRQRGEQTSSNSSNISTFSTSLILMGFMLLAVVCL